MTDPETIKITFADWAYGPPLDVSPEEMEIYMDQKEAEAKLLDEIHKIAFESFMNAMERDCRKRDA